MLLVEFLKRQTAGCSFDASRAETQRHTRHEHTAVVKTSRQTEHRMKQNSRPATHTLYACAHSFVSENEPSAWATRFTAGQIFEPHTCSHCTASNKRGNGTASILAPSTTSAALTRQQARRTSTRLSRVDRFAATIRPHCASASSGAALAVWVSLFSLAAVSQTAANCISRWAQLFKTCPSFSAMSSGLWRGGYKKKETRHTADR